MDSTYIEEMATFAVKKSIFETKIMTPYINSNDKEPMWDGSIYVYKSPDKKNKSWIGRVPVQVKGKTVAAFSDKTIAYTVDVHDLLCYEHDGGVLYFVVQIHGITQETKVYFAALTQNALKTILSECKETQQTRNIALMEFPDDTDGKLRLITDFIKQRQQVSGKESEPDEYITRIFPGMKGMICQRLTADEKNRERIQSFECRYNFALANYLKTCAWEEDLNGETAYYLVKDAENNILMFFSLKCGVMFNTRNTKILEKEAIYYNKCLSIIEKRKIGEEKPEDLEILKAAMNMLGVEDMHILEIRIKYELMHIYSLLTDNPNNIVTREKISAIELVHFCMNDAAQRLLRKSISSPYVRPGEVLFWNYVAPLMEQVAELIGFRCVYSYVADVTADARLVNYYDTVLRFQKTDVLDTIVSDYDFGCELMYQDIRDMEAHRKEFFEYLKRIDTIYCREAV